MKKILGVIAMLVAMLPFAGVKAEATPVSYTKYNVGDVVNFYRNAQEKAKKSEAAGTETIVLDDGGTSSKYVKVLMISSPSRKDPGSLFITLGGVPEPAIIGSEYWNLLKTDLVDEGFNLTTAEDSTPALEKLTETDSAHSINYITVNELKSLTTVDTSGNISNKELPLADGTKTTLFDMFTRVAVRPSGEVDTIAKNGFYTSTIEGDQVYVVSFTFANNKVTAAKLKKVSTTAPDMNYAVVGVGYFDKTFDCHYTPACYVCGTEYKWITKGTQEDSCTLVPNVTTAEDCVPQSCYLCNNEYVWAKDGKQDPTCTKVEDKTTEAECRKNPKTGVESHILEFAIVAALCAIALLVVKRKDLFRTI